MTLTRSTKSFDGRLFPAIHIKQIAIYPNLRLAPWNWLCLGKPVFAAVVDRAQRQGVPWLAKALYWSVFRVARLAPLGDRLAMTLSGD